MARIERMRKVNEYVEQLKSKMKEEVRQKLKDDQDAYKALLKDLLIQVSTKLAKSIYPYVYFFCFFRDLLN